jgi:hypothetical protein
MESKYKERAKEIIDSYLTLGGFLSSAQGFDVLQTLMCQLAEEVEKNLAKKLDTTLKVNKLYTKKQVEELLQKQRELCNKEAYCEEGVIGYTWQVNENSILNAKLKID